MNTNLKPCPFCGRHDTVYSLPLIIPHECYYVRCSDCGAQGPCKPTREEAEAVWNARSDADV